MLSMGMSLDGGVEMLMASEAHLWPAAQLSLRRLRRAPPPPGGPKGIAGRLYVKEG